MTEHCGISKPIHYFTRLRRSQVVEKELEEVNRNVSCAVKKNIDTGFKSLRMQ
jgi:hypothetical protein